MFVAGKLSADVRVLQVAQDGSLYAIEVGGQYLMSVTPWDAQAAGSARISNVARWMATDLERALTTAVEERSPNYIRQAVLSSVGIAVGTILLSLLLVRLKGIAHTRFEKQLQGFAEAQPLPSGDPTIDRAELADMDEQQEAEQAAAQQRWKEQKHRLKLRKDSIDLCFQTLLIVSIVTNNAIVLNFFPQTRFFPTFVLHWFIEVFSGVLLIIFGTYLIFRISFVAIDRLFTTISFSRQFIGSTSIRLHRRLETLSNALKSLVGVVIITTGALIVLSTLGVDIERSLTGAGLFGLAISFASQNFIKDVINGFFIILEDQYGIGDIVASGGYQGVIEDLNLRVTRLRSPDGKLIVIPNGSISVLENLTSGFSRVDLGINVAYDTDLDFAMATISQVAGEMARDSNWKPSIINPPNVLGVDAFGDNSITIRVRFDTLPGKQMEVGREFRRRLKYAFDQNGISIPFPQRTIWFETPLKILNQNASETDNNLS